MSIIRGAVIAIYAAALVLVIGNGAEAASLPTAATKAAISAPLRWPIADAAARVTKKTFGLYVTPKSSPVQPDRFTGYHTGVDFETTVAEQKQDVVINVACDGTLLVKRWASGYGGAVVQSCKIGNQQVTVIYGHLQLASVTAKVGTKLKAGARLGILGRGFSTETDRERKHLHFAIHRGAGVSLLGYVQKRSALSTWLDPLTYLAKSAPVL